MYDNLTQIKGFYHALDETQVFGNLSVVVSIILLFDGGASRAGAVDVRFDDLKQQGLDWSDSGEIKCPYIDDGFSLSFSSEFYEKYKRRGFSLEAMCYSLGSGEVKFDPKTGRSIQQYRPHPKPPFTNDKLSQHPFFVRNCFRSIQVRPDEKWTWKPTGCRLQYDPRTGHKVRDASSVWLNTAGGAGGAPDPGDKTTSSVSSAKLSDLLNGGD